MSNNLNFSFINKISQEAKESICIDIWNDLISNDKLTTEEINEGLHVCKNFYLPTYNTYEISHIAEDRILNELKNINILANKIKEPSVLLDNLFYSFINSELNNFFENKTIIEYYENYNGDHKQNKFNYLSPLDLYDFSIEHNFQARYQNYIKNFINSSHHHSDYLIHPFIQQAHQLMDDSFKNPESFKNFISFWSESPRSFFSTESRKDKSKNSFLNEKIQHYYQIKNEKIQHYYQIKNEKIPNGKIVLEKTNEEYLKQSLIFKICDFFIQYPNIYEQSIGILPPAFIFMSTLQYKNIEHFILSSFDFTHLDNLSKQQHNSSYSQFIYYNLFSAELKNEEKIPNKFSDRLENLLSLNYDFDLLFNNLSSIENIDLTHGEQSKFNNFLKSFCEKHINNMSLKHLYNFYQHHTLNKKISQSNDSLIIKKYKI